MIKKGFAAYLLVPISIKGNMHHLCTQKRHFVYKVLKKLMNCEQTRTNK